LTLSFISDYGFVGKLQEELSCHCPSSQIMARAFESLSFQPSVLISSRCGIRYFWRQ
jgi:hypothetical protein